jgi:hypothetical protein
MVPEIRSPSLKNFNVASTAARKSSAEPMSFTATCFLAVVLVAICGVIHFVLLGPSKGKPKEKLSDLSGDWTGICAK